MSDLPKKPNFILFMTDQQRSIQDFPSEWVTKNLPNYTKFLNEGASFTNNICNTSPCGPSRASIFSGMFPANNGITSNSGTITPDQMHFSNILNDLDYEVHYMGKLHMREEFTEYSNVWPQNLDTAAMSALDQNELLKDAYKMFSWTSPDFGTNLVQGTDLTQSEIANLGGGLGNNDNRVITGEGNMYSNHSSVQEVIRKLQSKEQEKPFCLVISLLNPHDISLYPEGWQQAGYSRELFENRDYENIVLPKSYADSLDGKPTVQATFLNTFCKGKLMDTIHMPYASEYLKFYAYLHTLSDALFGSVMDSLSPELIENTVLIRMADHGEMGMAHGGLQEKNFTMYNEMIRVPMIWKHHSIPAGPREQLVSLIDLVPTLSALAGADLTKYSVLQGKDYSSSLFNMDEEVQSALLYNYNYQTPPPSGPDSTLPAGMYEQNPNSPQGLTTAECANNIYAIIKKDYKFAVYYSLDSNNFVVWSSAQFELYNISEDADPNEMNNLIPVLETGKFYTEEQLTNIEGYYAELTNLMESKKVIRPLGWYNFKRELLTNFEKQT